MDVDIACLYAGGKVRAGCKRVVEFDLDPSGVNVLAVGREGLQLELGHG